ncbi:MAG: TIGR01212 family radical SAM protein [Bacillota bacterium]
MAVSEARYNIYSHYLKEKFGGKVHKLPVNLPGTCPNRDGTVGHGGCIFCDEAGAGFQCLPANIPVGEQIKENMGYFQKRHNAEKFIVYFQSFTNTYMSFGKFREIIKSACLDRVVGISISTRPDCINDLYIDFLQEIKREHGLAIDIELGLQTVNYHTLVKINRGHTLAEFIDAVIRINKRELDVCAHLILNLPWDNLTDVVENAKIVSALGVKYVKLHSLYIVANTLLGSMYKRGEFDIMSLEGYVDSVIQFLEHLDPGIVIQRLVGKGPAENTLFSNWGTSWWKVKQMIEEGLAARATRQGAKFNYLNGSALAANGMAGL